VLNFNAAEGDRVLVGVQLSGLAAGWICESWT
jgi:hypothetical protein